MEVFLCFVSRLTPCNSLTMNSFKTEMTRRDSPGWNSWRLLTHSATCHWYEDLKEGEELACGVYVFIKNDTNCPKIGLGRNRHLIWQDLTIYMVGVVGGSSYRCVVLCEQTNAWYKARTSWMVRIIGKIAHLKPDITSPYLIPPSWEWSPVHQRFIGWGRATTATLDCHLRPNVFGVYELVHLEESYKRQQYGRLGDVRNWGACILKKEALLDCEEYCHITTPASASSFIMSEKLAIQVCCL